MIKVTRTLSSVVLKQVFYRCMEIIDILYFV